MDQEHDIVERVVEDVLRETAKSSLLTVVFAFSSVFGLLIVASSFNRGVLLMALGVVFGLTIVASSLRYLGRNVSVLVGYRP
ncbi:hypothetical protein [Halalkalicoccus subterraneus]|uniref:hypothetical protein n=1 Tax=Halalkalicoccus subterraneus TaxID=2675002 RepID=UPI000EFD7EB5|nr:hypothetical protein [Halalkalicoccus subterraneus]